MCPSASMTVIRVRTPSPVPLRCPVYRDGAGGYSLPLAGEGWGEGELLSLRSSEPHYLARWRYAASIAGPAGARSDSSGSSPASTMRLTSYFPATGLRHAVRG